MKVNENGKWNRRREKNQWKKWEALEQWGLKLGNKGTVERTIVLKEGK